MIDSDLGHTIGQAKVSGYFEKYKLLFQLNRKEPSTSSSIGRSNNTVQMLRNELRQFEVTPPNFFNYLDEIEEFLKKFK